MRQSANRFWGELILVLFFSVCAFFVLSCGNPIIQRSLVPSNPSIKNTARNSGLYASESVWRYHISDADQLSIDIANVQYYEFEAISETEEPREKTGFRIPGLSYMKYIIQNDSNASITIDLFQIRFVDNIGNEYAPITKEEFTSLYTSEAYRFFRYDSMFAFYVTEMKRPPQKIRLNPFRKKEDSGGEENKIPEKQWFYYYKFTPGATVVIPPRSRSFQIIPYPLFSEAARQLTIQIPGILSSDPKEIEFEYEIKRGENPLELNPEKFKRKQKQDKNK